MNELLNKFLEGEIDEAQYNSQVEALDETAKKEHEELLAKPEVAAAISKKATEELAKVTALRKEGKRIEGQPPKTGEGVDYAAKLREENVGKAMTHFFSEFKISPEQQSDYKTAFESSGNTDVSEEYIYEALEEIYVKKNRKSLLGKAKERDEMVNNGQEFNADSAGAPGSSGEGSGDSGKAKDPKVLEWIKDFEKQGKKISYEDAERVLTRGMTRVIG